MIFLKIMNAFTELVEDIAGAGAPLVDNELEHMQSELNRQADMQCMEEGIKSVTPFDYGGDLQGYGFNPSDTMAADMNSMDNMGMM